MKRKQLLIIIVLALLIVLGVIWKKLTDAATATGTADSLSSRAQEFITQEQGSGDELWSSKRFATNSSSIAANTKVSTSCFTVTLPVETANHSQEEGDQRCTFRAKVLSPPAQLTISSYESTQPQEDTGILMRQKNPDQYFAFPIKAPQFALGNGFRGEDNVIAFAWKNRQMVTVSFHGMSQPELVTPKLLETVLTSVDLTSATMKEK
jgi:hypothetical protein